MRLAAHVRELIKRPIQKKFESALPMHSGDSMLLSLLGKIVSRPGFEEKAFGEAGFCQAYTKVCNVDPLATLCFFFPIPLE